MSAIPSLSVWSSIKIPLTEYYERSWNEIRSPVPYVGSWKPVKQKSISETTSEVVNLRVPSPFRKGKENSLSEMSCVRHSDCIKDSYYYDDFRLISDDNFMGSDTEMELNCIPSVKPCTSEELCALTRRYRLIEEKPRKQTEKKKKHKRRIKTTKTATSPKRTSCLDSYKSFSQNFRQNDQEELNVSSTESFNLDSSGYLKDSMVRRDSFSPVQPTGKNYYETKLAELYMIELGIKR